MVGLGVVTVGASWNAYGGYPVYQAKNREFCPFWDSFADYGDTSL